MADTVDYQKQAQDADAAFKKAEADLAKVTDAWTQAQKERDVSIQIADLDQKIKALDAERAKQVTAAEGELKKAQDDLANKSTVYENARQKTDPAVKTDLDGKAKDAKKAADDAKAAADAADAAVKAAQKTLDDKTAAKAAADKVAADKLKAQTDAEAALKKVADAQTAAKDVDRTATDDAKRAMDDAASELSKVQAHTSLLKGRAEVDYTREVAEVRATQEKLAKSLTAASGNNSP